MYVIKVPNMKKVSIVKVTSKFFVNFLLLLKIYLSKLIPFSGSVTTEHSLNNLPLKAIKVLEHNSF